MKTWCRGDVRFDQIALWEAGGIDFSAIMMALERGDTWCLPALYAQKSGLEPPATREDAVRLALDLARAHGNRRVEQGTIGPPAARSAG